MYLTLYVNQKAQQLTWEDIINNPFIKNPIIEDKQKKKITIEITKEYSEKLWNKTQPDYAYFINEYDLSTLKTEEHYTHFQIPKKSNPNKKRKIDAPDELLSSIQLIYKGMLEQRLNVLSHKAAHAYVSNRSTVTAMQTHQKNNSKWYLQLDLKDFFNSINGTWLKNMLLQVYPFPHIDTKHLDNLIKVALLKGVLPQGSHLSPTLTNLAMVPIDHVITEKLHNYNKHHYVYTRYADDITISCKEKFNANEIINIIKEVFKTFDVPFKINNDKTRFGSTAGRNYHLGLIVNKDNKLSVGHEKNQKFRAMINNFCLVGSEWEKHDIQKLLGLISYYKSIEPTFVEKVLNKYNKKYNTNILNKIKEYIK